MSFGCSLRSDFNKLCSLKNLKEGNRKMVEYQRGISTFRREDFIKTNATQTNSLLSDDATYVNISSMTQGEDLYENTTEGYLDTNDLRPTTCLKESNSKMVKYPNSSDDLRPTTCIRSNKDKPGSTLADYIELC